MIWCLMCVASVWHPAHTSLAQCRWNGNTSRMEVSLRLSSTDAIFLRRQAVDSDKSVQSEDSDAAAVAALRRHLRFRDDASPEKQAEPEKISWLGEEEDGFHVWWHFEWIPANAKPPTHVRCTLLERHRDVGELLRGHGSHAMVQMTFVMMHLPDHPSITLTEKKAEDELPR